MIFIDLVLIRIRFRAYLSIYLSEIALEHIYLSIYLSIYLPIVQNAVTGVTHRCKDYLFFLLISLMPYYHLKSQLVMIAVPPELLVPNFKMYKLRLFAIRGVTINKVVRRRNFPKGNEFFHHINIIKYITFAVNLISYLFSHYK